MEGRQGGRSRYCLAERQLTPTQKKVEEVIEALGLCGPFDSAHIIEDLSAGEVRERVLNTVCFQTWANMRKIFGTKANTTAWETSSDVMGTVRVILDSIGLTVSAKRTSKRETGTDSRTYLYKYWVSTDSVTKMQELLALKDGNAEMAGRWAHLLKQGNAVSHNAMATPTPTT
eukprot:jgi/Astpho2/7107/Aster-08447